MATKNELKWQEKYEQMKAYILEHRHLPGKRNVENRGLLNWWKYNRKLINHGQIDPERQRLLAELGNMRDL
ncbi:MAG: helicase associated domain-containing protein [Parabacteroides sp.]|nr:helicase associated domain-containing protein [Parabacteroides distasonis]MCI6877117.1 helicase associated domain-containing protein [Parabacteroides sp.]MDD6101120.1 helicase associated domain-containing protein [bacterium]MDD6750446.1 helicase associated domain-containing protein [bacterium]MDD6767484.1 helicase associated domain-containing protein [bacterium]